MKSTTCMSNTSNSPLSEYENQDQAIDATVYIKNKHGHDLTPYHCDVCNKWHLSPKGRQTPSTTCSFCTDSNGHSKQLYESQKDAQRRAEIRQKESNKHLSVYPCPNGHGWHLTSHKY